MPQNVVRHEGLHLYADQPRDEVGQRLSDAILRLRRAEQVQAGLAVRTSELSAIAGFAGRLGCACACACGSGRRSSSGGFGGEQAARTAMASVATAMRSMALASIAMRQGPLSAYPTPDPMQGGRAWHRPAGDWTDNARW